MPGQRKEGSKSNTHKVDQGPNILVDRQVRSSSELLVGRKPRRERRMRKDELALGQRLTERLRERCHPRLGRSVTLVHRSQVLVVDVDPVKLVRGHELCHSVGRSDRVSTRGGRLVGGSERGDDEVDARGRVFGLLSRFCVCGEVRVCESLVCGAGEGEERQRCDVEALCTCAIISDAKLGFG